MPLGVDDGLALAYSAIKTAAKNGQDRLTLDGKFWGAPDNSQAWTLAVGQLTQDGFKVEYDPAIFVTRIYW